MKRYTFIQTLLAAATLFLASCSAQDEINLPPDNRAVNITTTLGQMQTRAAAPYTGSNLSLSMKWGEKSPYTNIQWNLSDTGTWKATTSMFWEKDAQDSYKIDAYAYAPWQNGITDLTAVPFSIQTDQIQHFAKSDLVGCVLTDYSPYTDGKNMPMHLPLTHRLSKLTVKCVFGNEIDPEITTIKEITLTGTNIAAVYNAITGIATPATPAQVQPVKMHPTTASPTVAYECILVPQTIAGGTQMATVTLSDNRQYNYTVPATASHAFASGSAYTLLLTIGKDRIDAGEVTISDWGDGSDIPGGEALPIPITINTRSAGAGNDLFVATDQVNIFVGTTPTTFILGSDDKWLTANGKDYVTTPMFTLPLTAVYPASTTATPTSFALPADQSSAALLRAADYMTSEPQTLGASPADPLAFALKHRMSKISLQISGYGKEFNGTVATIDQEKIHTGSTQVTPFKTLGEVATGLHRYEAIVAPVTYAKDATLISLVANGMFTQATLPTEVTFEAGKQYSFKLTIKKEIQHALHFTDGGSYDRNTNNE